jgi:UDP-N-acetylglucosamine acyltransferase
MDSKRVPQIHPTAIVDRRAELADGVRVDAYAVIEGHVVIGAGSHIRSHSVLQGHTLIGAGCTIGPAAHVGLDPQFLKFDGSETSLIIGEQCVIREGASVHRSIKMGEEHATRLGARCFLMGNSHVGHDCRVGDDVILANGSMLGGHVTVGARAFLGGGAAVHQFCQVGRLAMISGLEPISRDVPPFSALKHGGLKGYNAIGCRRAGIPQTSIHSLRRMFKLIHENRTTVAVVDAIRNSPDADVAEVKELLSFIAGSRRGIQPSVRFLAAMARSVDDADD